MTHVINDGKITFTLSAAEAMDLRSHLIGLQVGMTRSLPKCDSIYSALTEFAVEIQQEANDVSPASDFKSQVEGNFDNEKLFNEE